MAEVLQAFVEPPRACDYLAGREAALEYRMMADVSLDELQAMLERGWRRLGPFHFRPRCAGCLECVSLRLPVAGFRPTESQRRARRRTRRFRAEIGPPRVDRARLDLYRRWHAARETARGWEAAPLRADEYWLQFGYPHPAARELTLWDGDRVVSVGIWDFAPRALSAVYCFYDPAIARLSPGVANVLLGIEEARARAVPHVYLGYRVLGCPSMRYKSRFGPHELLLDRPRADEAPRWLPAGEGDRRQGQLLVS
jgi:arginine-tRNA-protein transferase